MPKRKLFKQIKLNPVTYGMLCVTISASLYGLLGFFGSKILALHFSVANMLFWRFFIAALWMLSMGVLFKRRIFSDFSQLQGFWKILLLGCLCYSGSSGFYFLASQQIGTGIAMVIFFSYPIFVFLLCWLFSNYPSHISHIFALALLGLGLILLKGSGIHTLTLSGLMWAMFASLSYATYVFGCPANVNMISTLLLTLIVCMGNAGLFLLLSLMDHSLNLPSSLQAWLYIFGLGIVATALPIQLMLEGLKSVVPLKASILSVFEPVVTVLVGVVLLHEAISLLQAIGILIILLAAILIQFDRIPRSKLEKI